MLCDYHDGNSLCIILGCRETAQPGCMTCILHVEQCWNGCGEKHTDHPALCDYCKEWHPIKQYRAEDPLETHDIKDRLKELTRKRVEIDAEMDELNGHTSSVTCKRTPNQILFWGSTSICAKQKCCKRADGDWCRCKHHKGECVVEGCLRRTTGVFHMQCDSHERKGQCIITGCSDKVQNGLTCGAHEYHCWNGCGKPHTAHPALCNDCKDWTPAKHDKSEPLAKGHLIADRQNELKHMLADLASEETVLVKKLDALKLDRTTQ